MRIAVCVRQGLDGEINPFDACAYEEALKIEGAEITLLSMGPESASELLLKLTRLGAKRAVLLSDRAFAGADTLATAYTLSLALKKISPDFVFCGRQTLIGDTAQTGAMLSVMAGYSIITNVLNIDKVDGSSIRCTTREEGKMQAEAPALITVERINSLRLPRLRSKLGELEVWSASDIGADISRCGLKGSPTRVLKTFENQSGKRKCKFISKNELENAISCGLKKKDEAAESLFDSTAEKFDFVCAVGDSAESFAENITEKIIKIPLSNAVEIERQIRNINPPVVLWGSDTKSKRLAAMVAAKMNLGLCADCTAIKCEGGETAMYRPALSGSIIAKIKSLTRPAMATVRSKTAIGSRIIVAAGDGVKGKIDEVKRFASDIGAEFCSSRKLVDNGCSKYEEQVGLTGKTVSPDVYIAIGISGAVQHIVGMERSGTVIAINPDKNAPIFEYSDYGILEEF